ncbi:MAG: tetratricopeptide repeat protein, partial [Nanopusillaceae archaeon]
YTSDDHLLMHIYNWLGVEYLRKGDYSNAILYESKSLKLAKRFGDVEFERNAFINMGVISQNEGNNYKALEYYKKALELGNIESGVLYNNIALIYLSVGNYKKAIEYFKKAINVAEENGHFLKSGEWILNLGNAYRIAKDYKNGKFYLEKGLERVKKAGNKRWEALGYTYFGLYYKDTDNKALAKEYLTKAYNIFKAIGDSGDALKMIYLLSSIK